MLLVVSTIKVSFSRCIDEGPQAYYVISLECNMLRVRYTLVISVRGQTTRHSHQCLPPLSSISKHTTHLSTLTCLSRRDRPYLKRDDEGFLHDLGNFT